MKRRQRKGRQDEVPQRDGFSKPELHGESLKKPAPHVDELEDANISEANGLS